MADISYCNIEGMNCSLAYTCKRWINNKATNVKYYSVALFKPVINKNKTTCDYYIDKSKY